MDKLEKVIKGITLCNTDGLADEMCPNCPYVNEANPICVRSLFNDALELLKEQQAENQFDGINGIERGDS